MKRGPKVDPGRYPCGHPRTPENTTVRHIKTWESKTCRTCENASQNARRAGKRRHQTAAERCSGAGGRGCPCPYHVWRRNWKAASRKADRAIARVQTKRDLAPPKHDAKPLRERRYITTPRIQQIIAECRPLYLRAIGKEAA